jgi:hypothetical protein
MQLAQKEMAGGPPLAMSSKQSPNIPDMGTGDRKEIDGGGPTEGGPRNSTDTSSSAYLGLPPRDRQAIQQSQKEKYPAEYAPMVEQYLRNLSDQNQR